MSYDLERIKEMFPEIEIELKESWLVHLSYKFLGKIAIINKKLGMTVFFPGISGFGHTIQNTNSKWDLFFIKTCLKRTRIE